jgi:ribulose-phosphate 3-epimerase
MPTDSRVKIAPSILAADFARLGEQITQAEEAGADRIHIDVMDGVFVPNISIGIPIVLSVRRITRLPLETHLMIVHPENFIDEFIEAGSDTIIFHQEATPHLHRSAQTIRALGKKVGISINPGTPTNTLDEILEYVDLILLMTVNPGFGGQKFIPSMLLKIEKLRQTLDERGLAKVEIEVDGGIDHKTAPSVIKAGATALVAGSAVFSDKSSIAANMQRLLAVV